MRESAKVWREKEARGTISATPLEVRSRKRESGVEKSQQRVIARENEGGRWREEGRKEGRKEGSKEGRNKV